MRKLIVFIFLIPVFAFSQSYVPEKINKKAVDTYQKAVELMSYGELKQAIPVLEKAISYDKNFIDAYLSLGGVYGEMKDYTKALQYYEIAKNMDTQYFRFYNLPYSINLAGTGRFPEALAAVEGFLSSPNLNDRSRKSGEYRKHTYEFAISFARTHPKENYQFNPQNMGDNINSSYSEYYPSFTIDDSTFVFTRRGEGIREDFLMSKKTADGYSKAELIKGSLNAEPSKGGINISQDGLWLIFAGNFPGKGAGDFDLYISYNTESGWSDPINLGPAINTQYWESSPSLSPDKEALYFSSNRPGGYGGKDLYVSYRGKDGQWGKPVNMGPNINTSGDELAPFIHADNNTLYFTSNGLAGYGGTDLYLLRKDESGNWGKPENLGYPINTIENDGSLFIASDGISAFYASDRADSRGGLDLYRFELPAPVRPAKTLYVQGTVSDAKTGKPLPSMVELTNNSNQQTVSKVQTDETGFYFVTLPVGRDYTVTVNRKGYLFYSSVYELSKKDADSTYVKNIALQPIALNSSVVLHNILFDFNSATLLPVSKVELNNLLELMNQNPQVKILIKGHTDNVGTDARNMELSVQRSKAVADYLIENGIAKDRLSWKGFGATQPVASNDTEAGRAQNRRTEFEISGLSGDN